MKTRFLAAAAIAALLAAPAVQAAQVLVFDNTSGTFGNANIPGGNFTNTFNFTVPSAGILSLTISSTRTSPVTALTFSEVSINGQNFTVGADGIAKFRFINDLAVLAGNQTLLVRGRSGGNASYSGTITFSPNAGIPEPATWAMMIGGLGVVGFSLRRRRALETA